jgi:CRISPR-associated endonuclease/helicase Cas3
MEVFDEKVYREFFRNLTGHAPFDYQVKTARLILERNSIVLRAPTGAGKTWAVLAPFLFCEPEQRPARLIYALPLRTLAQGIYREAREAAAKLGLPVESQQNAHGREIVSPFVTLQTGEQPDDRFFDRGTIIVTTYDQLLSGFLDGPYGLSDRLHNINAAALAGSLVVFDEFHLMEPNKAFLTAVAALRLFQNLSQSAWMTATATQPLEKMLLGALAASSIPENETEASALLNSLPSVTQVTRNLAVEPNLLSAESVLSRHEGRSIVLLNTVGRAQTMYEALRKGLAAGGMNIPLLLLHSRFFKEDRRRKEEQLKSLFGKGAKGPAILVSTQVVEAGLDLSCEHLHTELCPMNALVQRGGRCARFAGETGTVHVYPLPAEERAWLPYGDLNKEDETLTRTREVLARVGVGNLHPQYAATWVQEVHAAEDEHALREGWWSRLRTCLQRIEQNAIHRDSKRVADLIRGEDTDALRVTINETDQRPESPGQREGLNLSRRSLYRLVRSGGQDLGWYWDGASDEEPWKPLLSPADLDRTYAVCLRPVVASYDNEIGLRLGVAGTQQSPKRQDPPRPGYAPLRAESWSDHAHAVAEAAQKRLEREHWRNGLLGSGFIQRYGLSSKALSDAVKTCALLHDLGKLQDGWQRWAEAAQRAQLPTYQHTVPLAHTDFDPEKKEDRERERNLGIRRPAHAPASAFYSGGLLARLLPHVLQSKRTEVAAACAAAILAHHGGWLPKNEGIGLGISKLYFGCLESVASVLGWTPEDAMFHRLETLQDKQRITQLLLQTVTSPDNLTKWWPLVAYLTRTLRLSDQRATAERACHEGCNC